MGDNSHEAASEVGAEALDQSGFTDAFPATDIVPNPYRPAREVRRIGAIGPSWQLTVRHR
jgi:hypothetical protein